MSSLLGKKLASCASVGFFYVAIYIQAWQQFAPTAYALQRNGPDSLRAVLHSPFWLIDNSGGAASAGNLRTFFSLGPPFPLGVSSNDSLVNIAFFPFPLDTPTITGCVRYYTNIPVPGVQICLLSGTDTLRKTPTDREGQFRFIESRRPVELVPVHEGGFERNTAITVSDAAKAWFHVDRQLTLIGPDSIASDVDQDSSITLNDVTLIFNYALEKPPDTSKVSHTGEWRFDPDKVAVQQKVEDTVRFTAILLGDNNGTWQVPDSSAKKAAPHVVAPLTILQADFSDTITVPIAVPQRESISTAFLKFTFDAGSIKYAGYVEEFDTAKTIYGENVRENSVAIAVVSLGLRREAWDRLALRFVPTSPEIESTEIVFSVFRFDDRNYELPRIRLDAAKAQALPTEFALYQNYPNPFNPATTIEFDIPVPEPKHASLIIYDLTGRNIRTLIDRKLAPGRYSFVWDGATDAGKRAASGLYFYRLRAESFVENRKMLLLR